MHAHDVVCTVHRFSELNAESNDRPTGLYITNQGVATTIPLVVDANFIQKSSKATIKETSH
jgi:hypothetical protein